MATKTFEELKQLAIQIRDEKTNKANTATRIGTQMIEHLNKLEQEYNTIQTVDGLVSEYNVSVNHPTSGIDGSNKYTLSSAIALVPEQYRTIGIKCSFIDSEGYLESWKYLEKNWSPENFRRVDFAAISYLAQNLFHLSIVNTIGRWDGQGLWLPSETDYLGTYKIRIDSNRKYQVYGDVNKVAFWSDEAFISITSISDGDIITPKEGATQMAFNISPSQKGVFVYDVTYIIDLQNKDKEIEGYLPFGTLYHKKTNLALNPNNFSRFGYYANVNNGTAITNGNDSWGINWTVIFIPVKSGIIYTITKASGPDKQRKIVMVNSDLKVTHGIENTESEITAKTGDIFLAVQYGADVRCSETYDVTPSRILAQDGVFAKQKITGKISANTDLLQFGETKIGYYNNKGLFVDTSSSKPNWKTVIIPIEPSKEYKWVSYYGTPNANHAILGENKEVIKLLPINKSDQYRNEQSFVAEDNHFYFALEYEDKFGYATYNCFKPTTDIVVESISLEKQLEEKKDGKNFSVIDIPYIFGMVNSDLYSREYVVRLFPESFLNVKPDVPALVNYRRDVAISRQRKTTTMYEKLSKKILLSAEGYSDETISLDFHAINEKIFANKNIRLSLFGVSFDNIDYKNDDGTNEEGGTMTAALLEKYLRMSAKDNSYTVNYVSIGTLGHANGDTFQYNGDTLNSRGKHEARGGHNGVCYLRQPMNFSPTNVDYDPNVSGTSATGLIQWLMNGLRYRVPYNQEYSTAGTDYGTFEKTAEKLKVLRYTPFGKYHHDYAEELWEFCNKKGWIGKVSGSYGAWTGSAEQKQIIDKCMDYVAENPYYPFYDRDTARQTSYTDGAPKDFLDKTQYALNYNKYLERYRTMDDLGVRLSVDDGNPAGKTAEGTDGETYTIGSKVTSQELLKKYDVCKPTHVIWDMAYNDWGYYGSGDTGHSDGTDSVEMSELFISAVRTQLGTDIVFGLKAKKENGAFYPEVWSDICLGQPYTKVSGHLVNYNKLLISKYSDLSQKVTWIPIFPVSLPFATNYTQEFNDFVYNKVLVGSGDTYSSTSDVTHEGLRSAKVMTYQIYGWLAYTIKDL